MLGGSVGLAVANIILNKQISDKLSSVLSSTQLTDLQQSLSTVQYLDPPMQITVARVFSDSFSSQMRVCAGVSAVGVLIALATWQRNPPTVEANIQRQRELAKRMESSEIALLVGS